MASKKKSKPLTDKQVKEAMDALHLSYAFKDSEGQLVLYTGLYEWTDGSIHNVAE